MKDLQYNLYNLTKKYHENTNLINKLNATTL